MKEIKDLMTIHVQDKDLSKITGLLQPYGYPITHIASTGGFLGKKYATLLIGLPSRKRPEIRTVLDNANVANKLINSDPTGKEPEFTHEGATILSLAIERYEET